MVKSRLNPFKSVRIHSDILKKKKLCLAWNYMVPAFYVALEDVTTKWCIEYKIKRFNLPGI